MKETRDFKGIWIPKEIWLNKELSAIEKVILVEIDSLDNEDHCFAGNEYFADFCNCSTTTVSRAISHLSALGYIEISNFDGRKRLIKMIKQTNQNDKADSSKRLTNNIANKQTKKEKSSTKVLLEDFATKENSIQEKPKKKNLYEKCLDIINEYTDNEQLKEVLITYLKYRLEVKDRPLYANMWKGMINKLRQIDNGDIDTACAIIQQSLNRGYLGFFPVNTYTNYSSYKNSLHDKINESGITNVPHITKEEEMELQRKVELGELDEY